MPMLSFEDRVLLATCAIAGILILGVEFTLAAPRVVGAILVGLFALIFFALLFLRLKRLRGFGA
jgi:hypothetical protein